MRSLLLAAGVVSTVLAGAAFAQPANDSCATAEMISGLGTFTGDSTLATNDGPAVTPCQGATQANKDIWFVWHATEAGYYRVQTCGGATFDTVLAVYEGAVCPAGTLLACSDDACGTQSSVAFIAQANQPYLIRVGGYSAAAGGAVTITIGSGYLATVDNSTYGKRYALLATGTQTATAVEALAVTLGGHLVAIGDAGENEFIRTSVIMFDGANRRVWIGANDAGSEGVFVWTTGAPATYQNWFPGEPNDSGANEDYVEMFGDVGTWNDVPNAHAQTQNAVLEFPLVAPCPADVGGQGGAPVPDGLLDNNDFVVYINYFFNNDSRADVGRQGGQAGPDEQFDNNDFIVFINLFFNGCGA